jgi:hypothetical protein
MAFHDSNLTSLPTRRLDGKINFGWNNKRGVAHAIEEFFDIEFREDTLQVQEIKSHGFVFFHQPWCNGLSILAPCITEHGHIGYKLTTPYNHDLNV